MRLIHALAFACGVAILLPFMHIAYAVLAPLVSLPTMPWRIVMLLTGTVLTHQLAKRQWLVLSLLTIFLTGLSHGLWSAKASMAKRLPADRSQQTFLLDGCISELPRSYEHATSFQMSLRSVQSEPTTAPLPNVQKAQLNWYGAPELRPGQCWRLKAKLAPPHGLVNPAGFDFERYAAIQGIDATGYVVAKVGDQSYGQVLSIDAWRAAISGAIVAQSTTSDAPRTVSRETALLQALAVGDTRAIAPADWDLFRRLGITHLIAISGLHVTLFATLGGLLCLLILRLFPNWMRLVPRSQSCAMVGLLFAFAYTLLAGFNAPALRTLIMLASVLLGILLRRVQTRWQGFALALMVLLLFDPLGILSAGLWLSFTAVALLMINFGKQWPKPGWWRELWQTQWLMSLGLLPLSLLFFQGSSLWAPLVNLLAIPLFTMVVVPLTLAACVLLAIAPILAKPLLGLAVFLLEQFFALSAPLQAHAGANLHIPAPAPWALLLAVLAVLVWFAPQTRLLRKAWALATALMLSLPLFFQTKRAPEIPEGAVRLTLFDVGQGLSALVQTANHQLLFDTGPGFIEGATAADRVINPSLLAMQVNALSQIVVSHADADHAGGLNAVRLWFPDSPVATSAQVAEGDSTQASAQVAEGDSTQASAHVAEGDSTQASAHVAEGDSSKTRATERWSNSAACQAGQSFIWDGVRFEYLHPNQGLPYLGNQSSCVLRVQSQHGAILLPGDIDEVIEGRLIRTHEALLRADVLIAPHHGSAKSSSAQFLNAVKPSYVLYPVGHLNRFQFPRSATRQRVQTVGAVELLTSELGAITMQSGDNGWQLTNERARQPFWWRAP